MAVNVISKYLAHKVVTRIGCRVNHHGITRPPTAIDSFMDWSSPGEYGYFFHRPNCVFVVALADDHIWNSPITRATGSKTITESPQSVVYHIYRFSKWSREIYVPSLLYVTVAKEYISRTIHGVGIRRWLEI